MSSHDAHANPFDDDAISAEDFGERAERWDANDPRRQKDPFAPPAEPCECHCLHCGRVFMSDQIWLQKIIGDKTMEGFWMCPTPNCDGAGFTFDIFPTDPNHPANDGWVEFDEEDYDDENAYDEAGDYIEPEDRQYDPNEPKYKELDEAYGDEDDSADDDIEGEEWKFGLQPGEDLPEPQWVQESRKRWEAEQKKYDAPDERPRELDWTNKRDEAGESQFREDDIPF